MLLSAPFSILGLLTIIKWLEVTNFIYFDTVYRVTYPHLFSVYLTGNYLADDLLIVSVGVAASIVFFYKNIKILIAVSGSFLSLALLAIFIESESLGDVTALACMPSIAVLYTIFCRPSPARPVKSESLVASTACVLLAIEVYALFGWAIYPAIPSEIYTPGWQWFGAELQAKLSGAFGMLSPILMVLLIFSFGLKPAPHLIKEWLQRKRLQSTFPDATPSQKQPHPDYVVSRRTRWLFLSGSLALSVVLSIYPYIPSINSNFQTLSVDARYYIEQIDVIRKAGLFDRSGPFNLANERALSILVFYGIAELVQQPAVNVVAFMPIFLGSTMVLSVYYLVRFAAGKNHVVVLVAPLLAAISTQFIVGFYGGFFSNMVALSVSFVAILFLLKYQQSRKWSHFGLFILTLFLVLFIHVYTWVFFSGVIIIAIGILAATAGQSNSSWKAELSKYLPVIIGVAATVVTLLIIASQIIGTSGLDYISGLARSSLSEDYLDKRVFNVNYSFRIYVGGFLSNSLMLLLALIWAFKADYRKPFDAIFLSSFFISIVFLFFGDSTTQARMFYNMPLQISAAFVIANIMTGKHMGWLSNRTRSLVSLLAILHLTSYAFSSVANFYLILPS